MRDQEMVLPTPGTVYDVHMTPQLLGPDGLTAPGPDGLTAPVLSPNGLTAPVLSPEDDRVVFLFDVDGTLCESQQQVAPDMKALLREAAQTVDVGLVSGSDAAKVLRQFGVERKEQLAQFG
ncbi:hypothetical protein GNI_130850, partial [Gregarina niphandrodes]